MNKKTLNIILLIVLTISQTVLLFQVQTESSLSNEEPRTTIKDMDLINLRMNNFMNPSFEDWTNPYNPKYLSHSTSKEHACFYASSPVSEGSRSMGIYARASNIFSSSESILTQTSWPYWNNPVNVTLSFDYYLESLPNTSLDYFEIQLKMSYRTMFYYLGSNLSRTNGTSQAYFMTDFV
ncbi:MAG: hypothetical protein ACTSW1_13275 [Candidatus Hodarchaeales archaeon]